jgi:hypothetical protein
MVFSLFPSVLWLDKGDFRSALQRLAKEHSTGYNLTASVCENIAINFEQCGNPPAPPVTTCLSPEIGQTTGSCLCRCDQVRQIMLAWAQTFDLQVLPPVDEG